MVWRRLHPGELDHEWIWLGVSVGCALGAWFWLHFSMPLPKCVWHEFTGLPCPTCGATRCVRFLTQGAWLSALLINPLFFLAAMGMAIYDLYAVAVLALRLPRLRLDRLSPRVGTFCRWGFLAILMVNWSWLVYRHV